MFLTKDVWMGFYCIMTTYRTNHWRNLFIFVLELKKKIETIVEIIPRSFFIDCNVTIWLETIWHFGEDVKNDSDKKNYFSSRITFQFQWLYRVYFKKVNWNDNDKIKIKIVNHLNKNHLTVCEVFIAAIQI
jgi:hypothetical protein